MQIIIKIRIHFYLMNLNLSVLLKKVLLPKFEVIKKLQKVIILGPLYRADRISNLKSNLKKKNKKIWDGVMMLIVIYMTTNKYCKS